MKEIVRRVSAIGCPLTEITGGEPLEQKDTPQLCEDLLQAGFEVLVETNGTCDIDMLPRDVKRIMDIKCPGSGASGRTDWENLPRLKTGDEVKFIIGGRIDYEWAKQIIAENSLLSAFPVLFSPVSPAMSPQTLAEWILEDRLNVRFQLQLHRIIWPDTARGK